MNILLLLSFDDLSHKQTNWKLRYLELDTSFIGTARIDLELHVKTTSKIFF